MASYIFYTGTSVTGFAADISTNGDSVYVMPGVAVNSVNSTAIFSNLGSRHSVTIRGVVSGDLSGVVINPANTTDGYQRLTVHAGAELFGRDGIGASVIGFSSAVVNAGTIEGFLVGVQMGGTLQAGVASRSTLSNSGLISGFLEGVLVYGDEPFTLTNTGRIESVTSSSTSFRGVQSSPDTIINNGTMVGVIILGDGADVYDGRKGAVTGRIEGNEGADKIYGGRESNVILGGSENDYLSGGIGNDVLLGGSGRDTLLGGTQNDRFDFDDVAESGITAQTRDLIADFVKGQDKIDLSTIDAIAGGADHAFIILARGTAASAVAQGRIGWYQENPTGTVNDKTILRINNDADTAIDMTIEIKGLVNLAAADFIL